MTAKKKPQRSPYIMEVWFVEGIDGSVISAPFWYREDAEKACAKFKDDRCLVRVMRGSWLPKNKR